MIEFEYKKKRELIKDSSLWHSNFIPSVHDSFIIIGSGSVICILPIRVSFINVGLGCFYQNSDFSFLGQVTQYCLLGLKVCLLRIASPFLKDFWEPMSVGVKVIFLVEHDTTLYIPCRV